MPSHICTPTNGWAGAEALLFVNEKGGLWSESSWEGLPQTLHAELLLGSCRREAGP